MRYFKFGFILIFIAILAACTTTEIQTEYVIVTATPEAIVPIPTNTSAPTMTSTPVTQLVIAVQDIPAGNEIQADMVEQIRFPAIYAPMSAFTHVEDVIGLYTDTRISPREFIIARRVRNEPKRNSWEPIRMLFARHDIAAGEMLGPDMYFYAFVEQNNFEELGIHLDDVFDTGQEDSTHWVITSDIRTYEPILEHMVSPMD